MATKPASPVDLSAFDEAMKRQEEGIPVEIVALDGKTKIGLTVTASGPDSERTKKAQQAIGEELAADEDDSMFTPEANLKLAAKVTAKRTIGWAPAVILDGKELAYSEANAVKLYMRHPFIREQVEEKINKRRNFMPG